MIIIDALSGRGPNQITSVQQQRNRVHIGNSADGTLPITNKVIGNQRHPPACFLWQVINLTPLTKQASSRNPLNG